MRLLKIGNISLNGAYHGLSFLLGGKFGIKLFLKDLSKCLSSLFGQNKIESYSKWHKQSGILSFVAPFRYLTCVEPCCKDIIRMV